jgi:hypothetical protein
MTNGLLMMGRGENRMPQTRMSESRGGGKEIRRWKELGVEDREWLGVEQGEGKGKNGSKKKKKKKKRKKKIESADQERNK